MKVLITGGAGFIGHHLALHLKRLGYEVVCLDNLSRASEDALKVLRDGSVKLLVGDVVTYKSLREVFNSFRPEVVVHAAALISVDESFEKPEEYFNNNVVGTLNVVRSVVECGVLRLIYVSSAAVYGDPVRLPIREDHPTNPKSPYGLSKLFGEEVVKLYSRLYGFNYVILRLFNVYGPRQPLNQYSGVILKFVYNARRNLPLTVYGDGNQTRDFIHVVDVCRAVELSILTKYVNEVYNVGSGRPVSINELVKVVSTVRKSDVGVVYMPPRPGDIIHSYADISKATTYLGFKPSITIEEGIRELLEVR
ncbi:MAG: SDR family NAD(P)-dependent oxidoreductase [Sulfolobales archaeon]